MAKAKPSFFYSKHNNTRANILLQWCHKPYLHQHASLYNAAYHTQHGLKNNFQLSIKLSHT